MKLTLTQEKRQLLIQAIQKFFLEERDEEIGIIAADRVLDFFINNLGNTIHNLALDEAHAWFSHRLENLEVDYDQLYRK